MGRRMCLTTKSVLCGVALALCLCLVQIGSAQSMSSKTKKSVYVCSCMGTKSCPCMGMSAEKGKCVCGKEMKAVARDSAWAQHNRKTLE